MLCCIQNTHSRDDGCFVTWYTLLMTNLVKLELGFTYNPKTGIVYDGEREAGTKGYPKPYIRIGHKQLTTISKTIAAHNLIWVSLNGEIPEGFTVDHINGVPSDNRIKNLRCVSVSENYKNKSTPRSNTSGHVGVSFHKASQKWRARIQNKMKERHLGLFDTKKEAIEAWVRAKESLGYHKNHGRKSIYI